jgi:hypothetical protein
MSQYTLTQLNKKKNNRMKNNKKKNTNILPSNE